MDTKILGIDEAGRGCVIGPMVLCGVVMKKHFEPELKKIGVKDSKELTPKKRTNLISVMKNLVDEVIIIEVSPEEIDSVSLTTLEMLKMAEIIKKVSVDIVYFDAPVPPGAIGKFSRALKWNIGVSFDKTKIIGENKADKNYPVVGAASIFAKVRRDEIINQIKEEYGDFGSGYTSDKNTIIFLKEYYNKHKNFPKSIFRSKWSTLQRFYKKEPQVLV